MKKLSVVEIAVIVFALVTLVIYYLPYLTQTKESEILAQVKASNAVFTSKVLEEFARNKKAQPSIVAQKIAEELNSAEGNPYKSGDDLYVMKSCTACSQIETDDNLKMIILTTLDKKGALVARTVIKPPSYVTYYKEEQTKK